MKHLVFSILFLLALVSTQAQNLLDTDSNVIVKIAGSQILTPDDEVIFTIKGNIIFEGATIKSSAIYYTLDGNSLNEKKKVNVYNNKGKSGTWFAKKGSIYYKELAAEHKVANVAYNPSYVAFYNAMSDSLMAYIPNPDSLDAAMSFAIFQILWHRFDLEAQYKAKHTAPSYSSATLSEGILAIVEPVFGGGIIWLWDGQYLYPANDGNQYLVWEFEDNKLSPRLAPRNNEEWSWDGETFKPFWGGHPRNEWTWNGNILRQIWNADFNKEFLYEDGVIRPRFGAFGENEWQVQGEIPKALLTAIVIGVLYR